MGGLILAGTFAVLLVIGELLAIGAGIISDKYAPGLSLLIFFGCSIVAVAVAWPIALRITRPAVVPAVA